MSLRLKFWAAFGVIAVLAICLALYGLRVLSTTGDLVVRLYNEPLIGVNYARAASASLSEARGLISQALFTGPDKSADITASLQRIERDIAEDLTIVRTRVHDADVTKALDHAESSIAVWFRSARMVLVATPDGVTALPTPALLDRQTAAAMAQVDDVVEHVAAIGFAFRSRAETEMQASRVTIVSLSGGIIAISVLFALLFAQLLIRPVRAATRIAEDVASGKFDTVITTRRRDEIGRLLHSLGAMQANLRSRELQAQVLMREQDQAVEALRQINLRFEAALNNMSHGLLMCDAETRVAVVNRRFCDLYGINPDGIHPGVAYREVIVLSVAAGNHPGRTIDEVFADCVPTLEPRPQAADVLTIAEGRTVAISHEPMPDGGWVAIHEDITDRRRSEEQIVFLARHDALTRLPNRVLFQERLNQALAQAERGKGFALLLLDLDRFKIINDTLGHPIGDRL